MKVVRIACIDPPETERSRWSRELLLEAIGAGVTPVVVPAHQLKSFTATLPPSLATSLKHLAREREWSIPHLAAGLIEAARAARANPKTERSESPADDDPELFKVRPDLHPLFKGCTSAIAAKKIPFAEASTGTGKGKMIALLAARAAREGKRVVITAPLAVTWQIADDLADFEGVRDAGVAILLGRANFVSPDLLSAWAAEHEHADMLAWIEAGGPARDPRTIQLQERLGIRLNWLLDDALDLAEDLEPSMVMLHSDDDQEDERAEEVYQSLQASGGVAGIVLCSHHFLAAYIRQQLMWKRKDDTQQSEESKSANQSRVSPFPERIDLLLVDEAHLLEQAFASIFSQALFLKPLERLMEHSRLRGRRAVLDALGGLNREVLAATRNKDGSHKAVTGTLEDFDRTAVCAQQVLDALDKLSTARQERNLKRSIYYAKQALKDILSGHSTLRLEVSPVRYYPQIMVGRANLDKPLGHLWAQATAAVLVSATLYSDGVNAGLTRWKLGVPTERAVFLPAVVPSWVTDPVRLHLPTADALQPDDSPAWIVSVAESILSISHAAVGGTLVLCTSYRNASDLSEYLLPRLGERLIAQSATQGASVSATKYRQAYAAGLRPVWIGVGAAWTGINLNDKDAKSAADDKMLTDLVITRLPLGTNRTLTHERRAAIAGFSVVVQEGVNLMRQGIGRLVRREGVGQRNLWILDPRLVGKEAWASPFRQALKRYQKGGGSK